MKKGYQLLTVLFLALSLLPFSRAGAQTESYIQSLTGVLHAQDSCRAVDEKFDDPQLWATILQHKQVQNLVTFEIRFDTSYVMPVKVFTCSLLLTIQYKDSLQQSHTLDSVKLTVQYDTVRGKPFKGIAYYKFTGGHDVLVKVKSITSPQLNLNTAAFLRIKNQILVERSYKPRPDRTTAPLYSTGAGPAPGTAARGSMYNSSRQMEIRWEPSDFAYNDYDLEYTFYDEKSELARLNFGTLTGIDSLLLEKAFLNNATRVSLNRPYYNINLVYPKGYLLVRVRAYRYVIADGEEDREEGDWHYRETDGIDGTFAIYAIGQAHEGNLSWQYSAAFAEEGKRKEVVSYFDGGFKSRQTVTINNSDSLAVVQENVFDKLNRPAVSILPVPTNEKAFRYFAKFNVNGSGDPYSYLDFNAALACASTAAPLSTDSGASRYYSPQNPFLSGHPLSALTQSVPDAGGYPFAVTDYTNDLTGRIRRQGGVGATFQLGNGHDTRYYYGKPSQEDLDRLFGSEAGNASHYSKNLVVDANGQVSVSYVDIAGKTVATALAGDVPSNVDALASESGATRTIHDELVRPLGVVRDADMRKISFSSTVLVPMSSSYTFSYSFTGRSLEMIYGISPEKKICADCYYDVKLRISDACNNPVTLTYGSTTDTAITVPALFNYGNSANDTPNTSCGVTLPSPAGTITAAFPATGEYKVQYELVMSRKALDFYMEYLKQANVLKTPQDFKKEYVSKMDLTGCFSDCRTCNEKIGTAEEFKNRIKALLENDFGITITTDDLEWITRLRNEALAACSRAVAKNCTVVDGCADQRRMMLKDLTPGGQYMLYDAGTLLFRERNINVFVSRVKNDPSSPEVVLHQPAGDVTVRMHTLLESEFITYWDPEWAYLLLKYHPEYCQLLECEAMSASRNRDRAMLQVDEDTLAAASPYYWNAANYKTFVDSDMVHVGSLYNSNFAKEIRFRVDTFLVVPVKTGGTLYTPTQAQIDDPHTAAAVNIISLRQFVRFLVYCQNKPLANPTTFQLPYINIDSIPASPLCNKPLEEWRLFRNFYMAIKQAAYRNPANKSTDTCRNCFIGVNAYSSLYNPWADPQNYPKLNDFVIEKNGAGLQVRFNSPLPVNNRCNVTIYKATATYDGVVATYDTTLAFLEDVTSVMTIPGASADSIDLYYVEKVINNYNHNLDGTTGSTLPNANDFDLERHNNPGNSTLDLRHKGKYPLLTKVNLNVWSRTTEPLVYSTDILRITMHPLEEVKKTIHQFGYYYTLSSGSTDFYEILWEYVADTMTSVFYRPTVASCPGDARWPYYFQKKRRFYESNDAGDLDAVLAQDNNGAGSSGLGDPAARYQSNCESQAEGWLQKLKACFTGPDSATNRAALKARLIAVCVKGADPIRPFGSSTTPDGVSTSYGDKSFKDAIMGVLGGMTPTCNDLLLDFPLPYRDKTPLNDELVNGLKDCGYQLLNKFKTEWLALGGSSSTLYKTLKSYIVKKYDPNFYLADAQIDELLATYLSGCPLKRPIRLPGILTRCAEPSTPTCLTCTQLNNVKQAFHAAYPTYADTLPNYYQLLAAFINRTYQMNVGATQVYSAIRKCTDSSRFSAGCTDRCAEVVQHVQNFWQVMSLSEYVRKYNCQGASLTAIRDSFKFHLATWLNLNMNLHWSYAQYDSAYFSNESGCASDYGQLPTPPAGDRDTTGCSCAAPAELCCGVTYEPLDILRTIYPNAINPRILALFFEMRRYTVCAPGWLPSVSYLSPYDTLVAVLNQHDGLNECEVLGGGGGGLGDGMMSGMGLGEEDEPAPVYRCPYWHFSFDTLYYGCGSLYDTTNTAGSFALCSQPLSPQYQGDPDECLKSTVHAALGNAEYAYQEYVKEAMRDYREAYFAKCLSITPSLVMAGSQKEYHHTLYYYDQSGNLVKTVPPKGVRLLNDSLVALTGQYRDEGNGDCYKNAAAPAFTDTGSHLLQVPAGFYPAQGSGPLTVECWVKLNDVNSKQLLIDQFEDGGTAGKAGYYAYIENKKLCFRLYGRSEEVWVKKTISWLYPALLPNVQAHSYSTDPTPLTRYRQHRVACSTANDITSSGPSGQFYHLVFQYSGDAQDPHAVKIYVNGILQTLNWTATGNGHQNSFADGLGNTASVAAPATDSIRYEQTAVNAPFTTAAPVALRAGAKTRTVDGQSFTGFSGRLKQLRLYNGAPDAADLRRNSFDACYLPAVQEGLVLWLPLHKAPGNEAEDLLTGNTAPITAAWDAAATPQYPEHRMPTYYAYNSLNQVIRQVTPDAGPSRFWYDRLGRLVVSQNAAQAVGDDMNPPRYSYTLYDGQGRINEVGEKSTLYSMSTDSARTPVQLAAWLAAGTDRQVTQTVYDAPDPVITTSTEILLAQLRSHGSRKRVVTSLFLGEKGMSAGYNYATHYVYDVSGNVKRLYQELNAHGDGTPVGVTKTVDYDFDLVSGKVNDVWYQQGREDQYLYRYYYDADNRLVDVQSGQDAPTLRYDARYWYYLHGPLGRTELGHDLVQGVDYAYTLQGWLKGINGLYVNKQYGDDFDMGQDGTQNGDHGYIPRDAYAYSLGYYPGDYAAIGTWSGDHPLQVRSFDFSNTVNTTGDALYNGNIAYTSYANRKFESGDVASYLYRYDQLNRLTKMQRHESINNNYSDIWGKNPISDYAESIAYDANGNITRYQRSTSAAQGLDLDDLTYHYPNSNDDNKLGYVSDGVSSSASTVDLDDQSAGNYQYDPIGNLISDNAEGIASIAWTVYGKIKKIAKTSEATIEYDYDAAGNRIAKRVKLPGSANKQTTYYFRDAQGNVLGVYNQPSDGDGWTWTEQHLYGSSRLGMWLPDRGIEGSTDPWSSYSETMVGSRRYELTNHLGNVLAVISDGRDPGDYLLPDILQASDYYPFGMQMPERQYLISHDGYRYGFNGKENDNEVKGEGNQQDYGMRIYDPRLGRFLSVDPLTKSFPWNSPYSYAEGDPINYIDIDGAETGSGTAQATIRPTLPQLSNLSVNRDGILVRPTQLFTSGLVNAGAYAPQTRAITEAELYAMIPPNAGAYMNPDGISMTVHGPNGAWTISLLKKVEPKKEITWLDRALWRIQAEKIKQLSSTTRWNVSIQAYEIITSDPSTLSDQYLHEVQKRLISGNESSQDLIYRNELRKRRILYEINDKHNPSMPSGGSEASLMPFNHAELWNDRTTYDEKTDTWWSIEGKGKKAIFHRFSGDGNGAYHWSGSTGINKNRKGGDVSPISTNDVPVTTKRKAGYGG